ncbi:hypothetical protein MKY53_06495 [Macrococcus sp. FSL R5-0951]
MNKNNLNTNQINEFGRVARAQQNQVFKSKNRVTELKKDIIELSNKNNKQSDELDKLLLLTDAMISEKSSIDLDNIDIDEILSAIDDDYESYLDNNQIYQSIETIEFNDSWEKYLLDIDHYSELMNINLTNNPFDELMSKEDQEEIISRVLKDYKTKKPDLDKYDYMFASISGVLCGLIDVFFVGGLSFSKQTDQIIRGKKVKGTQSDVYHLEKGKLANLTDEKIDKVIEKFSKYIYEKDKKAGKLVKNQNKAPTNINGWIGYLEERFKVPYDARTAKDLNKNYSELRMSPSNHHLKSLSHQPDILGLFFSIIDQFNHTTSVIDKGKIQIIKTPVPTKKESQFKLQGSDLLSKLFCGVINWLGHLLSDMAGASGSKRRGQGVPMPFFSLLQLFDFDLLKDKTGQPISVAVLAEMIYTKGIDFRMGVAQAIPVALNELLIRFFWTLKELCYNKKSFSEIISVNSSPEMRRLLLVGHGSLCAIDGLDAYIRSGAGHDPIIFFGRLNLIGWTRFGFSAYKEFISMINNIDYLRMDEDIENEWKAMYYKSKL